MSIQYKNKLLSPYMLIIQGFPRSPIQEKEHVFTEKRELMAL